MIALLYGGSVPFLRSLFDQQWKKSKFFSIELANCFFMELIIFECQDLKLKSNLLGFWVMVLEKKSSLPLNASSAIGLLALNIADRLRRTFANLFEFWLFSVFSSIRFC